VGKHNIAMQWNADANADGYRLYRQTMPDNGDGFLQIADISTPTVTYDDQNLLPDTNYLYKVRSYNGISTGVHSNVLDETTDAYIHADPVITMLEEYESTRWFGVGVSSLIGIPGNLQNGTPGFTTVGLTWNAVSGKTGYYVYREMDPVIGGTWELISDVGTESFDDTNLFVNTSYKYKVRAYDALSISGHSNIVDLTTDAYVHSFPEILLLENYIGEKWLGETVDRRRLGLLRNVTY